MALCYKNSSRRGIALKTLHRRDGCSYILRNKYKYMLYIKKLMKNDGMNLEKEQERVYGMFGGRKGKGKMM